MDNVKYVEDSDGWYWHTDNCFCGPFETKQRAIDNYKQGLEDLGITDQD